MEKKKYYYTYYSYEEWGRGYFGSRGFKCLPEEDVKYFGSSKDKTFKPKYKIIIKDDYITRAEAYADEIILQEYYKVVENPHFANKAYQTSTKFYYTNGSIGGKKAKELGVGVHSLSKEELSENGKKGGNKVKELGSGIFGMDEDKKMEARIRGAKKAGKNTKKLKKGIFALDKSERIEVAKMGGKKAKELGVGIHALTTEERRKNGIISGKKYGHIGGNRVKELGVGFFSLTEEEKCKARSKGGKKSGKLTSSQRWMCNETGFITTPGALTHYQKARGIDTSKRVRVS